MAGAWQLSCGHLYLLRVRSAIGSGDVAWCNECRRTRVLGRTILRCAVCKRLVLAGLSIPLRAAHPGEVIEAPCPRDGHCEVQSHPK